MKKGRSITLLTVIGVVLALLIVISFVSFRIPFYANGTYDYNALISTMQTDCDVSECYVYELTMKNNLSLEEDVTNIDETLDILETRLVKLGYKNYSVKAYKTDSTDDYNVRIVVTPSYVNGSNSEKLSYTTQDISAVVGYGEITFTDANGNELFDKTEIKDSYAGQGYTTDDNGNYQQSYLCNIVFTERAVNLLKTAQGDDDSMTLTIKLGDEEIFSDSSFKVSNVQNNSIAITGYSTLEAAKQKALQISTSGLMYEYEVADAKVVTPTLGAAARWTFIGSILIVVAAIIALFAVKYRGFAISVAISLIALFFVQLILFVSIPGINISAASLMALILNLLFAGCLLYNYVKGLYADFENGKTFKAAINTSAKKVLFPYLDLGAVLEIICLAGIIFAKGAVRDFAISLGIGVALSVFVGVLFIKWMVKIIYPLIKNKAAFFNLSREDK